MTKSTFVTGRTANKRAYEQALEGAGCFVVTSFTTYHGDRMYADALFIGKREDYDYKKAKRRQGKERYRVIVTPKKALK